MNKDLSFIFTSVLMTCFMTGCLTNRYEDFYKRAGSNRYGSHKGQVVRDDLPVMIRPALSPEEILDVMEDGYEAVGSSSFVSPYTPMSLAVDTAKKHKASLVLLHIEFKEQRKYTAIEYVPAYSTTRTSGTVSGSYGPRYNQQFQGCYSEDSNTTTYNPIAVERSIDIYNHEAFLYRRVDISDRYGILWKIPPRLPTERYDTPIEIGILGVIHGSQAERDGLKRDMVITAINGKKIRTRQDVEPFVLNRLKIEKVEVAKSGVTNNVEVCK